MNTGTVEFIYVASAAGVPTHAVDQACAVPGVGLEGDRYALGVGTFSKPLPDRELTLIEAEAIEALKHEYHLKSSRLARSRFAEFVCANLAITCSD
jgi:hypothetical protein